MANTYHTADKSYLDPTLRDALLSKKLATISPDNLEAMLFAEDVGMNNRRDEYMQSVSDANKLQASTEAAKMAMELQAKILETAPNLSEAGVRLLPRMQEAGGIEQDVATGLGRQGLLAEILNKTGSGLRDAGSAGVRVGDDFQLDPQTGEARGLLTKGTPTSVDQAKALGTTEVTTQSIPGYNGKPPLVLNQTVKEKSLRSNDPQQQQIPMPPTPGQIQSRMQPGVDANNNPVWIVTLPNGKITTIPR